MESVFPLCSMCIGRQIFGNIFPGRRGRLVNTRFGKVMPGGTWEGGKVGRGKSGKWYAGTQERLLLVSPIWILENLHKYDLEH